MYYSHFGLSQAPFKITPNTEFFFSGSNRGPILEALIYAITHGEGIVKVTGEVGSGKTMLCNMLQARLPDNIETVYLANPSVAPDEILHAIAFELHLGLPRGASRLEVMHALHEFLLKRFAEGKRVVVFVEESQGMPLATLEEIRLLSNLETQNDKLLQTVLFGQPELDANLREPRIRQLRERITHSFRLEPFSTDDIREYLMFRMRAAGYRGPDVFPTPVVRAIARASVGLTRRVNIIADKTLLAAFSENTHTIRLKHVAEAVRDSEFTKEADPDTAKPGWAWAATLVAIGAVAGAGLYAVTRSPAVPAIPPPPAAAPLAAAPAGPAAAAEPVSTTPAAAKAAASDTISTPAGAEPATRKDANIVVTTNTYNTTPVAKPETAGRAATTVPPRAPAPPAATPDAASVTPAPDLLDQRLAATTGWLTREAEATYSIQLLGTGDESQLRIHLKDIGKFIEINDIFVYRTLAKKKPSLTVMYGAFSDRRSANAALAKLPDFLKANSPLLRTVGGIRTELKQVEGS